MHANACAMKHKTQQATHSTPTIRLYTAHYKNPQKGILHFERFRFICRLCPFSVAPIWEMGIEVPITGSARAVKSASPLPKTPIPKHFPSISAILFAFFKKKLYLCSCFGICITPAITFRMKTNLLSILISLSLSAMLVACSHRAVSASDGDMPLLHVSGEYVLTETGDTFYIQGVNLGNWLNPEGYMFMLPNGEANSPRLLNDLFAQLVGPDETAAFWQTFKDCYITEDDIRFIASTRANTVRLPFHYALLTDDDFLGCTSREGFARLDSAVSWCKRYGLYVVLDMHDCPGGQTGDNIDDSYGYPFLFLSEPSQAKFCSLWREIAAHYESENAILGYEMMNEPIAHYFRADLDTLNSLLEPLYARCIDSIRSVDRRHIILPGGAQWNGNFRIFRGLLHDDNLLYACHRYGHPADENGIQDFLLFRDSLHIAMCMTETGHRPHEWLREQAATLHRNHIGLLWWPYKKLGAGGWMQAGIPDDWSAIQSFASSDRHTYSALRHSRPAEQSALPSIATARQAMAAYLDSILFAHCHPDTAYIEAFAKQ